MSRVIGIDLGTTNSCAAIVENGEPVIIPNSVGGRTTPSVVAFTKAGERLVGDIAKRQLATNTARTISSVKRNMATNWNINIDGKRYNAQMISAFILMQLKSDAEGFTGCSINDAVITVPAYFTDAQRQATKDAGKIAGLNVLRIINEPTSAALSYGLDHGDVQKVLVYDLGGGTFDVSVIEIEDGVITVLATAGNNRLGGDDFDERLASYIITEFKSSTGVDLSRDVVAYNRVKEAAENAKKELSTMESVNINLPFISQKRNEPLNLDMNITRARFNELIRDLVDSTSVQVNQALNDAGISASQLGKVLLVGGSTRVPLVQAKVRSLTGKEPTRNINPDECVAMGAAIMGSTLGGNAVVAKESGKDLLLLDVTPMSLSIETMGGVATRLIERNTTIPTRYSQIFTTGAPYASSVEIHVLQGERPMARDNKTIGRFRLRGIRKAPAGVPQIQVTFDIDANGILKVSAMDLDTGKQQTVTITADDRMSDEQIQQAMKDAQEYAGVDSVRKEAIEVSHEANQLLARVTRALENEKKTINKEEKKQIKASKTMLERSLSAMRLDKVTEDQVINIRNAAVDLEDTASGLLSRNN